MKAEVAAGAEAGESGGVPRPSVSTRTRRSCCAADLRDLEERLAARQTAVTDTRASGGGAAPRTAPTVDRELKIEALNV